MGSRKKEAQERQKKNFERRLEERLSLLSKKGIEAGRIDKDALVKKLRAGVRAVNDRLKAIAANEKRTEDLARIKAEKAAAPPPVKEAERKGKAAKEAPPEGKEKKKKKEKEKGQEPQVKEEKQEEKKQEKKEEKKEEKEEQKEKKQSKKKAKEE